MINIHSKYDNMHENCMFYPLILINNHQITSRSCMLSIGMHELHITKVSWQEICKS